MSKKKNVLYTYMESLGDYFPAQAVKCDLCGKVFKVSKGFFFINDSITCYKHFEKENLHEIGLSVIKEVKMNGKII